MEGSECIGEAELPVVSVVLMYGFGVWGLTNQGDYVAVYDIGYSCWRTSWFDICVGNGGVGYLKVTSLLSCLFALSLRRKLEYASFLEDLSQAYYSKLHPT